MKKILTILLLGFSLLANAQPFKSPVGWEDPSLGVGQGQFSLFSLCNKPWDAQISTLVARKGIRSIRFELRPTDTVCGNSKRAELYKSQVPKWMDTIDKFGVSIYYPADYVSDLDPNLPRRQEGHLQYHQLTAPGSPLWEIGTEGEKMLLFINYDTTGTGKQTQFVIDLGVPGAKKSTNGLVDGGVVTGSNKVVRGQWVDWDVYYRRRTDNTGLFVLYRNGQEVFRRTGPNANKIFVGGVLVDETWGYPKNGIYKWPWNTGASFNVPFRVVFQDEFRMAGPSTPMGAFFLTPNQAPVVDAGLDKSIQLPINTVTLNGKASDDGVFTSNWIQIGGPSATITSPASPITTVTGLTPGVSVFRLTATDNNGAVNTDEVQVVVLAANIPPLVNAGPDITINLPLDSTIAVGSASDPDASLVSTTWYKISGPNAAILTPNSTTTKLTGLSIPGTYQFVLSATDNQNATSRDTMQVRVIDIPANILPKSNAGQNVFMTLPINSFTADGSLSSDQDGSVSFYIWTKVSGPSATISNYTLVNPLISNLSAGTYVFQLKVIDNRGGADSSVMQAIVYPAPPANIPPSANAGGNVIITQPTSSVMLNGSGSTDPDDGIAGYLWTKKSGPSATITSPTSAVTSITGLTVGTYVFQLRVTDVHGLKDSATMTVVVNPAPNILPVVNAGIDTILKLPTNSRTMRGTAYDPDGLVSSFLWYKISGPSTFTIASPTNKTTVISNLVYGKYVFALKATDNRGGVTIDYVTITVKSKWQAPTAVAFNTKYKQTIQL